MSRNFKFLLVFLGFALPFALIYRAFLLPGPLAWGDAPFFSPENLKTLFNPPLLWNFKDNNFGAPQYYILWLYLPTFLYGLLNHFLGFGNDLLIRLVFYLPATVLGILGTWLFTGRFTQNIWGKFLGSFLYGFNTYILMLVDGGQVGVALAYGLFPMGAVSILGYISNLNVRNYLFALLTLFALVSADIRIALILLLFVGFVWGLSGSLRPLLRGLMILVVSVVGLSSYWIIPTVTNSGLSHFGSLNGLSQEGYFIELLNSLFLFQPHFPLNQFGKTFPTPFYFVFILIFIFGSLPFIFTMKDKFEKKKIMVFSLFFLFVAFLAKGGSDPLGQVYSWMINNLPLGVAFRDSSKFYIPLMLIGGLLTSFTVNTLQKVLAKKIFIISIVVIYGFLLLLIYPALLGNLTGVLGRRGVFTVGDIIRYEKGFYRTLWFEERPSQGYFSWEKPALSANLLHQDRPFASMIVGKYDLYNFFHSPQLCQWLDLLGVKYLFFPQNERKKIIKSEEVEYWQKTLPTISNLSCLSPTNLNIPFPAFTNSQGQPLIFAQKKAVLVVGGEEIYDQLMEIKDFSLSKQGFIFAEDERMDLLKLDKVDPQSLTVVFFDKDRTDLQMGYLKDLMISPADALDQQWKVWSSGEYLGWKYELLKQGINSKEFDFGKGVATSTVKGEVMKFEIPVKLPGNYTLAVRYTNSSGGGIKVKILDNEFQLQNTKINSFKWNLMGPVRVDREKVKVEIENNDSFGVLNTLALIPENSFKTTEQEAQKLTAKFKTVFLQAGMNNERDKKGWGKNNFFPVDYRQINPTKYELTNLSDTPLWLIFTDHFHPDWRLEQKIDDTSFPFYSMVNGIYVANPGKNSLIFTPQIDVRKGIILSILSFALITGIIFIISFRKKLLKK